MSIHKKLYVAILGLALFVFPALTTKALSYSDISGQAQTGGGAQSTYSYPSGSLVNDGGTIYFISGSTKIPFTSYAAFKGLGYSLKNVVTGNVDNYTPSQTYVISTANAAHPWSSWLSYKGTIYYAAQQGLIPVPSAAVFISNGGQWASVLAANKYDIAVLHNNPNLALLNTNDSRIITVPAFQFSTGGTPNTSTLSNTLSVIQPSSTATTSASNIAQSSTAAGTLLMPTLATTSLSSQFVIGSTTNQPIATFNFVASGSPVTIQELDFTPVGGTVQSVTWVSVGGQIAQVSGATSSVTGLHIPVPTSGVDVPVSVNYPIVSPNNAPTNQIFTLNLAGVKYSSGATTSSLSLNIPSHPMDLVAGSLNVSLASSGQALTENTILIAKVTVSGNAGGNLVLNQLPLSITSIGSAIVIATSSNVFITDDNGGYPIPVSYGNFGLAAGGGSALNITFNGDNTFNGPTSKTYDIYVPIQNPLGNPGSSSIVTKLGPADDLLFTDPTAGPTGVDIPGGNGSTTFIPNYPTTSVSVHN